MEDHDTANTEQNATLRAIEKTLTQILIRLEESNQLRSNLNVAYAEMRKLQQRQASLEAKVAAELPDIRNVRRVVYGAVGLLVMAGLSAAGIIIHAH